MRNRSSCSRALPARATERLTRDPIGPLRSQGPDRIITIELSPGWRVSSLPAAQNQDGHVVRYTWRVDHDRSKLHLPRTRNVDFLTVATKHYLALGNFFRIVRTGDEEQIVVQPGTATPSN